MKHLRRAAVVLLCAVALFSCQKVVLDDEDPTQPEGTTAVTFRIVQTELLPFATATGSRSQDIADLCNHICLAVFQDGERVGNKNQAAGDSGFGTLSLQLAAGQYRAVVLAHNQAKNPTTTNAEKITFGGDMSDTFLWTEDIDVEEGAGQSVDVSMRRAVAMVRLVATDSLPQEAATVQFYYTGGSSTINALTGKGCVNSKQKVTRAVTDSMRATTPVFDLYTFPRDDDNLLKIVVTTFDADGQTISERTIDNVPVARNQISRLTGQLFSADAAADTETTLRLTTDDEWTTVEATF